MLPYEQPAITVPPQLQPVPACTLQVKVGEAENEERARAARRRQAALNMEAQRAREQVRASATPQAHIMPAFSCSVEQASCHPIPPEPDSIVLNSAAVQGMPCSGFVLTLVWPRAATALSARKQTWSSPLQTAWQAAGVTDASQKGAHDVPGSRQAVWYN